MSFAFLLVDEETSVRAVGIWSKVRAALGFEPRSASSKAHAVSTGVQTALRGLATDVEIKPATRIPPGALATAPLFHPVAPVASPAHLPSPPQNHPGVTWITWTAWGEVTSLSLCCAEDFGVC